MLYTSGMPARNVMPTNQYLSFILCTMYGEDQQRLIENAAEAMHDFQLIYAIHDNQSQAIMGGFKD